MDDARAIKSQLRAQARARVGAMSTAERSAADRKICGHLAELADELGARTILGYLALPDEVRVDGFLAGRLEKGVSARLPRVVSAGTLRYANWRPATTLSRDSAGVLAPQPAPRENWSGLVAADFAETGLVLVPGRAFDETGGRVGRGQGYYDRLLSADGRRHLAVGTAYECQVVGHVPREQHDRDVDWLVTERGCRRFRGDAATATEIRETECDEEKR